MTDPKLIAYLDDIAQRAWPAIEQVSLGGWVLRANDGVTKRANSVFPAGLPNMNLESALERVKTFYNTRSITPRFQLTGASQPSSLDQVLDESGYKIGLRVAIQVSDLGNLTQQESSLTTSITETPSDLWLKTYKEGGNYEDWTLDVRRNIMLRIQNPKIFASCFIDDICVGVGLSVVEGEWAGLFGLVTLKEFRRRGVATAINRAIGDWAQEQGAKSAYLQVEVRNQAAHALYAQVGFNEMYEYWYRFYEEE